MNPRARRICRFIYTFLFNPTAAMIKNSVLLYYQDLFWRYRAVHWIAWGVLIVVNISAFTVSVVVLLQCKPFWVVFATRAQDRLPRGWKCIDTVKLVYAAAPLNICTDFALILIPMPILASLQLPRRQKITLMLLFGLIGFTAILEVIRAYYFQKANQTTEFGREDAISFLWASITVHVGIVAVSAPMVKPLFTRWKRLFELVVHYVSSKRYRSSEETTPEILHHRLSHEAGGDDGQLVRGSLTSGGLRPDLDIEDYRDIKKAWPFLPLLSGPFFMWGITFILIAVIQKKLEAIGVATDTRSLGLHIAYYGSHSISALTLGGWIFRSYGFKMAISIGLFLYGMGSMCFWPSSIQESYPGMVISMVVVGAGSGSMEIAANVFGILLGPQEYAEIRLNILQGFQAVGGLLAILTETTVVYESIGGMTYSTLVDVQWILLACGIAAFILAGVFLCVNLPELRGLDPPNTFYASTKNIYTSSFGPGFALSVFTLFWYVGGQEITTLYARGFLVENPHTNVHEALGIEKSAQALFAAGRFIAAAIMLIIRPRFLLLAFTLGLIVTAAIGMAGRHPTHDGIWLLLNSFFQGMAYPTIIAMAIRGLAKGDIKAASIWLVSSQLGAAAVPCIFHAVKITRGSVYALSVVVAAFAVMLPLPVYLMVRNNERERTRRVDECQLTAKGCGCADGCKSGCAAANAVLRTCAENVRRRSGHGAPGFLKTREDDVRRRSGGSEAGMVEAGMGFP
ncbi:major facilitator superfamily domain-containing protein [Tricharina praecox]|uniref:major facilitator superfamily domain-containing protein n=1 Tax=Tricharina praecox TaxID=43433 RepID=UPI00221E570A|nr:major facilitator superfamily domain-containing protein [Tricharina praecox]KAI5849846.1 major facilitator superfamily domain-containing protein [Tricharina praecox]